MSTQERKRRMLTFFWYVILIVGVVSLLVSGRTAVGQIEQTDVQSSPPLVTIEASSAPEEVKQVTLAATVNGTEYPRPQMAYITSPGEELTIEILLKTPLSSPEIQPSSGAGQGVTTCEVTKREHLTWTLSAGELVKTMDRGIVWRAPAQPGSQRIDARFTEERQYQTMGKVLAAPQREGARYQGDFNIYFLIPYPFDRSGKGIIEGYPIGIYPNEESPTVKAYIAQHRDHYHPPKYFIKVTPETSSLYISEHFRLGDFSPLADKGQIHFIALDLSAVKRLEAVAARLSQQGIPGKNIKILRAFLSPNELQRLRLQGVVLSQFTRYMYGDSIAFIVDADGDNRMDDLNTDGTIDIQDADVLANIIDQIERQTREYGGVGVYGSLKDPVLPDTPHVQFDMRGFRSRWRYDVKKMPGVEEEEQ
jgi:hypothetical protein